MCTNTNVWVGSQTLSMSWGSGGLSAPLRHLAAGWAGQRNQISLVLVRQPPNPRRVRLKWLNVEPVGRESHATHTWAVAHLMCRQEGYRGVESGETRRRHSPTVSSARLLLWDPEEMPHEELGPREGSDLSWAMVARWMWTWAVLGAAPVPPQPSLRSHGGQWEVKDRISWGVLWHERDRSG